MPLRRESGERSPDCSVFVWLSTPPGKRPPQRTKLTYAPIDNLPIDEGQRVSNISGKIAIVPPPHAHCHLRADLAKVISVEHIAFPLRGAGHRAEETEHSPTGRSCERRLYGADWHDGGTVEIGQIIGVATIK